MTYIGFILLGILGIVLLCGFMQGTFRRMHINRDIAFLLVIGIIAGALLPAINIGPMFSFSIGGFLIPFILCIYLMVAAARKGEFWRCLLAEFVVAAAVFVLRYFVPMNTTAMSILFSVIIGLIAGAVGYLIGRSRRAAFASAVMGIVLAEVAVFVVNAIRGLNTPLALGTGGMFDSIILSGIVAVALAAFVGEMREDRAHDERQESLRRRALHGSEQAEFHEFDGKE